MAGSLSNRRHRDVEASAEARAIFASFLDEGAHEPDAGIEPLVAKHPHQAGDLRRLYRSWIADAKTQPRGRRSSEASIESAASAILLEPMSDLIDESSSGVVARLRERAGAYGRYEIHGEIGRGGMGRIIAVWDQDLRRELAMKVLSDRPHRDGDAPPSDDPKMLVRFLDEAQVTGQLEHPGIVPVHELGVDANGHAYFTMQYVHGKTLLAVLDDLETGHDGWTLTRVLNVILRVCEAVAFAHSKSVIHRDLKPANIMVGRFGETYVMDWGLARVLGVDKRVITSPARERGGPVSLVATDLHDPMSSIAQPVVTMAQDVVGTPAYMAPEQARSEHERVGPRSDVYAIGAILYHMLAGHMPYGEPGVDRSSQAVLRRVVAGPPAPIRPKAKRPPELIAICERAMEREIENRYNSAEDMAEDIRRFVESRVVRAYRTGAWAEFKKWVSRNRGVAAALAAVVFVVTTAGFAVGIVERQRSRETLRNYHERAAAGLVRDADELGPIHPDTMVAMETWLRSAEEIVPREPEYQRELDALRERALPYTDADRAADRHDPALRYEFERLTWWRNGLERKHVQWRSFLEAVDAPPAVITAARASAATLEAESKAAKETLERVRAAYAADPTEELRNDLHEADLALLDAAGRQLVNAGLIAGASATPEERARARHEVQVIADLLPGIEARHAALSDRLDAMRSTRRTYRFADPDDQSDHDRLVRLVENLRALDPSGGDVIGRVRARRDLAGSLRETTIDGPDPAWTQAIASIANHSECPLYNGLEIVPQLGLVPLRRNARTSLWEFWHVLSGEKPEVDADGQYLVRPNTGMVFVLVPGGTVRLGAQQSSPDEPHYDEHARPAEGFRKATATYEARLAPFFISKYEMTMAQWERAGGENRAENEPGHDSARGPRISQIHPIENVTWDDCQKVLAVWSLETPTEAQWEHAARGGTTTPYWAGRDPADVIDKVNYLDAAGLASSTADAAPGDASAPRPEHARTHNDGYDHHAPVDALAPNPFGLYNVLGNVWEWCQDTYGPKYEEALIVDPRTGERQYSIGETRVLRGGGYNNMLVDLRATRRAHRGPGTSDEDVGIRPCRSLQD